MDSKEFLINHKVTARDALRKIDRQAIAGSVLYVVEESDKLIGSLTDGDIRRGLLKDLHIDDEITCFMNKDFSYLLEKNYGESEIKKLKKLNIEFAPVVNSEKVLVKILDVYHIKSILPIDVVIMAGGKGERLQPLTLTTPKSLLKVGNKPIVEHNIDRLIQYGVNNIFISIGYLGEQISTYFENGNSKGINISYITEDKPLGTIGAVSLIQNFQYDNILIMNADLLTNIDFEDFFIDFMNNKADMAVATIPFKVDVPYAVLETENNIVNHFKEKPTYTYFSSAGIYLLKRELLKIIPNNSFFNATDLIESLIKKEKSVLSFPILGYWLDIGKMDDYLKAQQDIKHIKL